MKTAVDRQDVHEAAEEIFELTKMSWIARVRPARVAGAIDLSESEFLALDWLARSDPEPLTVGEIQRHIHVLPAQMSRVIRSLESKGPRSLIRCQINPKDKRKINVTMTDAGRKAHRAFRDERLASTVDLVEKLEPTDRADLMRVMRQFRQILQNRIVDNGLRTDAEVGEKQYRVANFLCGESVHNGVLPEGP